MSLLPDLERELLRVARSTLEDDAGDTAPATPGGHSGQRPARRSLPSAVLLAVSVLVALVIGGAFVLSLHSGHTRQTGSHPQGTAFPGAPQTQRNGYGVATGDCPLARPNKYLPAWSGCLTVRLFDATGDGRPDLVLLYSRLSHAHVSWSGAPAGLRKLYVAKQAVLRIVRAGGGDVTAPVRGAKAAAILTIAHVNGDPGQEIFIQTSQISSGATAVVYGYHGGRVVPAGVTLAYGGDSAYKAGFDCLAAPRPGLVQRTFVLIGPTIYAWWKETAVTYVWNGPRLVRIADRTFRHRGLPPASQTGVGAGCVTRVG